MRLWSISFRYLDAIGLVALWRESLLAKAVLEGRTRGYRNHPQLLRFKALGDPLAGINTYLSYVLAEGEFRGYRFDRGKVDWSKVDLAIRIPVTRGQLRYELELLRHKLSRRSPGKYEELKGVVEPEPAPIFVVVEGDVEPWERARPLA